MVADKAGFEAGHWQPLPGGLEFADDYVTGFAQAGTHCDALGHMWFDDTLWNGYPAHEHQWRHDQGRHRCRSPSAASSAAACCSTSPASAASRASTAPRRSTIAT